MIVGKWLSGKFKGELVYTYNIQNGNEECLIMVYDNIVNLLHSSKATDADAAKDLPFVEETKQTIIAKVLKEL